MSPEEKLEEAKKLVHRALHVLRSAQINLAGLNNDIFSSLINEETLHSARYAATEAENAARVCMRYLNKGKVE